MPLALIKTALASRLAQTTNTGAPGPRPGAVGAIPRFTNPLRFDTITELIIALVNWLLGISTFLALLAVIWGGIKIVTALDRQEKVEDGKKIIFWAVIGLMLIVASFTLINTVGRIFGIVT